MSMKEAGKPVSFVEDCAVPLEHLAEYTDRLTQLFERHRTRGTWYAHASVGCLHVRPVLNLRLDKDVNAMRAIAEEAFEMVRAYKGSHSGEHGDGMLRSEFHEQMFGARLVRAFEEVKDSFDPAGLFNPGKIVHAPKFDDRNLFRYAPDYKGEERPTALDWSAYAGASGGFLGAVEMCNNNGACRKVSGGVMCPSFRVTREERDSTRGRANTLRLALTGQLGSEAFTSDDMAATLELCVSCKACRRECPTGVDMARMKIEVLAARAEKYGLSLHEMLVGFLPRYAPLAARFSWLMNLRDALPGAAALSEAVAGLSARRPLRAGARIIFATPRRRRPARMAPRSCCSSTRSTAISSGKISMRRSRCSRPPAAACKSPSRTTATRGRCAAGARFWPSARSIRRGARPSAHLPRSRRSSPAVFRSWGSSRAASSASAMRSRRCSRAMPRGASPSTRSRSRNFWSRGRGRAGFACRSGARSAARSCTAIATRNPSASCRPSRRC